MLGYVADFTKAIKSPMDSKCLLDESYSQNINIFLHNDLLSVALNHQWENYQSRYLKMRGGGGVFLGFSFTK